MAVSALPLIAFAVGYLLTISIQLMNFSVVAVEQIPFSLLDNIYITTFQSWLIMGLLISVVLLLQYKRFAWAVAATCFSAVIAVTQWAHLWSDINKEQLVVYKVNGQSAFELIEDGTSYFEFDSALAQDAEKIRFHIRPNRLISSVKNLEPVKGQPFVKDFLGGKLINRKGRKILLIESRGILPPVMSVDVVIIRNDAVTIEELRKNISFKMVILDGSNSPYFAATMLKHEHVHSVFHHGAYIQNL